MAAYYVSRVVVEYHVNLIDLYDGDIIETDCYDDKKKALAALVLTDVKEGQKAEVERVRKTYRTSPEALAAAVRVHGKAGRDHIDAGWDRSDTDGEVIRTKEYAGGGVGGFVYSEGTAK